MTDLVLQPDVAAGGGVAMRAAGRAVTDVRHGAAGAAAQSAAGRPWGDDDVGAAFERSYRPVESALLAACAAVGSILETLGDDVQSAVASTVEGDRVIAHRWDTRA